MMHCICRLSTLLRVTANKNSIAAMNALQFIDGVVNAGLKGNFQTLLSFGRPPAGRVTFPWQSQAGRCRCLSSDSSSRRMRPLSAAGDTATLEEEQAERSEELTDGAFVGDSSAAEGEGGPQEATKSAVKKRLVSGVQPTGSIHLGNYLGAIKNWIPLQEECETILFVVDLHAITLPHDPAALASASRTSAAIYLACGVDPEKATVFVQSHVRAHSELTWLLSCATPISWLNKMIQFKEKALKACRNDENIIAVLNGDLEQTMGASGSTGILCWQGFKWGCSIVKDLDPGGRSATGEDVGTGLLTYPLLMASDILLYQCDVVPVGEDQRQHLELTRDVAARINNLYGGKKWKKRGGRGGRVFKVPEAMIPPAGARVMSLTDGTAKMSKSSPSDMSRINLLDPPDVISNKIKRCKTDAFVGMEFDNPERPECNNLLTIYQLVTGMTREEVAQDVQSLNWGQFKPLFTDAVVAHVGPIQARYGEVMSDPSCIDKILSDGAEKANAIADRTLRDVYDAFGFLPPRS